MKQTNDTIAVLEELLQHTKILHCPECMYPQYCPCKSCKDRLPKDKKPWIWETNGEIIACANCKHTMHADGWENESYKNYKHYEQLKKAISILKEHNKLKEYKERLEPVMEELVGVLSSGNTVLDDELIKEAIVVLKRCGDVEGMAKVIPRAIQIRGEYVGASDNDIATSLKKWLCGE